MLDKEALKNFLDSRSDKNWDVRSISLSELGYKNLEELKVNELVDLLDYITVLKDNYFDEVADCEFDIKIKFDNEPYYLLEMKWR